MLNLESELNPAQLEATRHCDGPLLVLAGAGSGKTRVITYKIAHLVESRGYKPWQILAVTFTNKAAKEMRERIVHLMGPEASQLWLGTFHSICLRVLRRHADLVQRTSHFVIYDEDDRERLIKRVMKALNIAKDVLNVRQVKSYLDQQKHLLRGPDHPNLPTQGYIQSLSAKVYKGYEEAKKRADAFDFGDLIMRTVVLMEAHPPVLSEWRYRWRYLLVDEFQDTDHAQYKLLKLLAGEDARLCVVGDDDQSIYRWRGADVTNILGFPKHFPGKEVHVVRLEENYRSVGNILRAASTLIRNNTKRHDKTLYTRRDAGSPLKCYQAETENSEARWVVREAVSFRKAAQVPLAEIAIFYRTHSQSRVFEDALRARGVPYVMVGGLKFYERMEVKDILAYLRVVQNPRDDIAVQRVINVPRRGIGAKTIERALAMANEAVTTGLGSKGHTANDATTNDATGSLFAGVKALATRPEGKRARRALEQFIGVIARLRTVAQDQQDVFRVAEAVLAETGYLKRLEDEGTLESQTRAENVEELMTSIEEWRNRATDRSLPAFLDHVSLMTSADEGDEKKDAITLMTVHAAKGLEFEGVFVTGLEEDVFPHFNSKDDEAIEEERRLAYVAITRGKQRVHLSWARSRRRFGRLDVNPPSRFLAEIPDSIKSYEAELGGRAGFGDAFGSRGGGGNPWAKKNDWEPESQAKAEPSPAANGGWAGGAPASATSPPRRKPPVRTWNRDRSPELASLADAAVSQGAARGDGLVGKMVSHPRFGRGRVARVDGVGPDARVTVQFRGHGAKKIIARFLSQDE